MIVDRDTPNLMAVVAFSPTLSSWSWSSSSSPLSLSSASPRGRVPRDLATGTRPGPQTTQLLSVLDVTAQSLPPLVDVDDISQVISQPLLRDVSSSSSSSSSSSCSLVSSSSSSLSSSVPSHVTTSSSLLHTSTKQWISKQNRQPNLEELSTLLVADATTAATPPPPPSPPTAAEIQLLRQAFAAVYGTGAGAGTGTGTGAGTGSNNNNNNNNNDSALSKLALMDQVVEAWQRQPPDERAGLYRVRGDVQVMNRNALKAIDDYTQALTLLMMMQDDKEGGGAADPAEIPACYLGRARALRTLATKASREQRQMAVQDYREALLRSAREEDDYYDSQDEKLQDGAKTNPYATWEYAMALRSNGQWNEARDVHVLASDYFQDIGDIARSVMARIDAGIDAAAAASTGAAGANKDASADAQSLLKEAIQSVTTVEGRDVALLQRVIAKEGEGRMALAAMEWSSGNKADAETQLTMTCQRLDQLENDALQRQRINPPPKLPPRLLFSIDDQPGALDTSCTKLKRMDFLNDRLEWPVTLQQKVEKLLKVKA